MKTLINAYACSPGMGSEPGMAWNWIVNLAKFCELEIITEGEFADKIEQVLPSLPQGANMHFHYIPVSDKVRRMCWNQGDWRFYRHYRHWQWRAYLMARDLCNWEHIDILHQLNMIGFREPGYLWKLSKEKGIPFVWGPVDAKDKFPVAYLQGASLKQKSFMRLKNAITMFQLRYSWRVKEATHQSFIVFAASGNSVSSLKKYLNCDAVLMNETGCSPSSSTHCWKTKYTFDILWVGKMDFRKQLGIALHAVARCGINVVKLHIVGGGDSSTYKSLANTLGIGNQCEWYGSVSHDEVQRLMSTSDLLLFTSVAEGTPHVVLESIANGLPVLCFDTCGQGDVVNAECGIKVPLSNPEQSATDFAKDIVFLSTHRDELRRMSKGCEKVCNQFSWENKARKMVSFYEEVTKHTL